MNRYLVTITMRDGSVGQHWGVYSDGFTPVIDAIGVFPNALRISARRLP